MEKIGYYNLRSGSDGPMGRPGATRSAMVMASFYFKQDIGFLFPYINAIAEKSELYDNPCLVRFVFEDVYCVLYSDRCIASPLEDHEHVKLFVEKLVLFLNEILEQKDTITPKFKVFERVAVTDIIKLLPLTNCGECGFKTCMAFAAMLSKQQTLPSACPYIGRPVNKMITYPVMDKQGRQVSLVTIHVDTDEANGNKKSNGMGTRQGIDEPGVLTGQSRVVEKTLEKEQGSLINSPYDGDRPADPLTPREIQVLAMLGQGLTNREISKKLDISFHTVKSHVVNIFNKLGVNHRAQAVVWAVRNGIV